MISTTFNDSRWPIAMHIKSSDVFQPLQMFFFSKKIKHIRNLNFRLILRACPKATISVKDRVMLNRGPKLKPI